MTDQTVALNIGELVKADLQAKIIQAFHDTPEAIDKLVKAALEVEVNEYGGKPDNWRDTKMPYLEWLAQSTIQQIARKAVIDYFEENEPAIRARIHERLASDEISDALTKALLGISREGWRMSVDFHNRSED